MEFQIGNYKDMVLCDIMPMDVCPMILGRPWQYDRKVVHDGWKNTYSLEKDGRRHTLLPSKDEVAQEGSESNILLMTGKELLQEVKKEDFALVGKPKVILTSTNLDDFPTKVRIFLDDYVDNIVDDLPNAFPPVRSISHHIELIPSASLPNKETYKLTPQEMTRSNNTYMSYWIKVW